MSEQEQTEEPQPEEPQPRPKHAGGRPKKPIPPPPPLRNSLEETIALGDDAARGANSAAKLRWYAQRAQVVAQIQARVDAQSRDANRIENEGLRTKVAEWKESEKKLKLAAEEMATAIETLTSSEAELRTQNEVLAEENKKSKIAHAENLNTQIETLKQEYAKKLNELTKEKDDAVTRSQSLLAFTKYMVAKIKHLSPDERFQYASGLVDFVLEEMNQMNRLQDLVTDLNKHRESYANYRDPPPGGIPPNLNRLEHEQRAEQLERQIKNFMRQDTERLHTAYSNIMSPAVIEEICELFSVPREDVRTIWMARTPKPKGP